MSNDNVKPVKKSGKITWNDTLTLHIDRDEVHILRTDIQVINTAMWDLGIIISSSSSYNIARLEISGKTIYFSEFDNEDKLRKLNKFLESCRRFTNKTSATQNLS